MGAPPLDLLLVEDDEDIASSVRVRLEHSGYHVRIADTVRSARAALESKAPDLVVLDLLLPDGSGFDLLRVIRQDNDLDATPVIILTCLEGARQAEDGFISGANAYLPKLNIDHLPAAIEYLIDEASAGVHDIPGREDR